MDTELLLRRGVISSTQAARMGMKHFAEDNPTAEPLSDLKSQAKDLNNHSTPRAAVWLPASSVEHLRNLGKLENFIGKNESVENFDGSGGILIARDKNVARQALGDREKGDNIQTIIGRLVGSGEGKPADGAKVVQQLDKNSVVRERIVRNGELANVRKEFGAHGRTVKVLGPAEVLARRSRLVAKERSA